MSAKPIEMPKALRDQVQSVAAPTMVPAYKKEEVIPQPEKGEEVVPALSDLISDKKDLLLLKRLIEEDLPWKKQESEAKKARKPIETKIKNLLGKHKITLAQEGEVKVRYYNSPRSSLDKTKLLEQGVTMAQITAATVTKPSYTLRLSVGTIEEEEEE